MVRGDWPELEYLVIGTGVKVLHANEAAASVSAAVQALNEANSALPEQPTAADVSTFAERYAAQVAPLEAAATALETEMAAIAPGQSRILDIIDDDHEATGVAEEYLGGAVSLGAAAVHVTEELATFPDPSRRLVGPYRRSTTRPPVWRPRCAECSSRWSQRADGGIAPPRSCPTGLDASGHVSRSRLGVRPRLPGVGLVDQAAPPLSTPFALSRAWSDFAAKSELNGVRERPRDYELSARLC